MSHFFKCSHPPDARKQPSRDHRSFHRLVSNDWVRESWLKSGNESLKVVRTPGFCNIHRNGTDYWRFSLVSLSLLS